MKIFVVNLRREPEKKERFKLAWKGIEGDLEFIEAVDGSLLDENELQKLVYSYPQIKLTKGEIGCALSHLSIYQRIVKSKIPIALILEDDAIPGGDSGISKMNVFLKEIEFHCRGMKNAVLFLQKCFYDCSTNKEKINVSKGLTFYKLNSREYTWYTHGYIVTYGAAKKLRDFILPIRYEADCWKAFMIGANIKVWACSPHIVENSDKDRRFSSLEFERRKTIRERRKVRKVLIEREIELREARERARIFPLNRFIKRKFAGLLSLLFGNKR